MTILAGQLAFIGVMNGFGNDAGDGTYASGSNGASYFSLVVRGTPIASGEKIAFTDGTPGSNLGGGNDGILNITFTSAVPAGSILIIDPENGRIFVSNENGVVAGSVGTSVGTVTTIGDFNATNAENGEAIYGYNGHITASNNPNQTPIPAAGNVIVAVDFTGSAPTSGIPAAAIVLDLGLADSESGPHGTSQGFRIGIDPRSATEAQLENAANFGSLDTTATLGELASITCFLGGTMIATPEGEVAVETLKIGDHVSTVDGRSEPVRWLGKQTVALMFADRLKSLPIRIRAGALGDNVPSRDLLVSPGHAIFLQGVLVLAGALVNGTSITRETRMAPVFSYYHVELNEHTLLLADNTPAESFVDNVDRESFDNWAEHERLYAHLPPMIEMDYPVAKSYRQVPAAIRQMLAARAAMLTPADKQVA